MKKNQPIIKSIEIGGLGIRECYANVYAAVVVSLKLRVSLKFFFKKRVAQNETSTRIAWCESKI